jgi:hypothetical protein
MALPLSRLLLQAAAKKPPDERRRLVRERVQIRLSVDDVCDCFSKRFPCKSGTPGQHLEKDATEGPDIGLRAGGQSVRPKPTA